MDNPKKLTRKSLGLESCAARMRKEEKDRLDANAWERREDYKRAGVKFTRGPSFESRIRALLRAVDEGDIPLKVMRGRTGVEYPEPKEKA